MRNGARPRRKSPAAAPGVSQSPEKRRPETRPHETRPHESPPPPDEIAGQPNDDVVELLVRVSVDALGGEPTGDPGLDGPAAPPTNENTGVDRSPATPGAGSDLGGGFLDLVESAGEAVGGAAVATSRAPARAGGHQSVVIHGDQVRFARLHLRTGSLLQARSEFEALAARGLLDVPAILELAEVRWRTGDLMGAGIAAEIYIEAGGEEALGFLVAAEAAAAEDRGVEARQRAGRALERSVPNLEVFFAGVPRRMSWPESSWMAPAAIQIEVPAFAAAPAAAPAIAAETPVEAPEGSLWAQPEDGTIAPEAVAPQEPAVAPEAEAAAVAEPAVAPEAVAPQEPAVAPEAEAAAVAEPEVAVVVPEVEAAAVAEPEVAVVVPEVEAAAVAEPAVAPEVEAAAVAEPAVAPEAVAPPEPAGAPDLATATVVPVSAAELAPAPEAVPESPVPAAANAWDGEVQAGAENLDAGDALLAALHFAVALRMSPESAQAVLDGIGARGDLALELVRGDALRLLGNESDAGQAYASVASRLGKSEPAAPEPAAPEPAAPEPAAPEPAAPEPAARADAGEQPRSIKWE
jgi:hypothetical protein